MPDEQSKKLSVQGLEARAAHKSASLPFVVHDTTDGLMQNGITVGHCSQCVYHLSTSPSDQISQAFPSMFGGGNGLGTRLHMSYTNTILMTLYELPLVIIPSCLHTTCASVSSQLSSHTVPQLPLWQISTRPSYSFLPPTSRMSELLQAGIEHRVY